MMLEENGVDNLKCIYMKDDQAVIFLCKFTRYFLRNKYPGRFTKLS